MRLFLMLLVGLLVSQPSLAMGDDVPTALKDVPYPHLTNWDVPVQTRIGADGNEYEQKLCDLEPNEAAQLEKWLDEGKIRLATKQDFADWEALV